MAAIVELYNEFAASAWVKANCIRGFGGDSVGCLEFYKTNACKEAGCEGRSRRKCGAHSRIHAHLQKSARCRRHRPLVLARLPAPFCTADKAGAAGLQGSR